MARALSLLVALVVLVSMLPAAHGLLGIFCADDGFFSGMSEVYYVKQALVNATNITGMNFCQSAQLGFLINGANETIRTLVVTTGIDSDAAALCTSQVLRSTYGSYITSILYTGTSGWSSRVGGPFNPTVKGGCAKKQGTPVAIGSTCITSSSIDMLCGKCIQNGFSDQCSRPDCILHSDPALFGNCSFQGDDTLAAIMTGIVSGTPLPAMPESLANFTRRWWALDEPSAQAPTNPTVLGPSQCVEADSHQIWVGGPNEYLCREYSAKLIGIPVDSATCVNAMEGVGFMRAMMMSEVGQGIPFVVVRGASNWATYPMKQAKDGSWSMINDWLTDKEMSAFIKDGYQYAIKVTNTLILSYVEQLANGNPRWGP